MVIPTHLVAGRPRKFLPLDPHLPDGLAPSHAVSSGWTTCRPITADVPIGPAEHPAITHFATCPARVAAHRTEPASTATEGTPE